LSLGDSDPKKRYTKSNVIIDESNYEQQEKKIKKKSATTNKIMRMRRRSDPNVIFENNLGFESCPRVLDQRPTRHMISWAKSLLKGLCLPAQA